MKKFLIVSPSYNDISGGTVVLHKLCDILNTLGYSAYLHPFVSSRENSTVNRWQCFFSGLIDECRMIGNHLLKRYKTNSYFRTPIIYSIDLSSCQDEWIVIYPEVIYGNPLGAKNVVRWFLHQPGFHVGKVSYASGELYFRFNEAIRPFSLYGSKTSDNFLKVIHYPLELYNQENVASERQGTAYCLRKGKGKKIVHDLSDSVLIDEKSHAEVAKIFKSVKQFISYDSYTAYSLFAALCGCESIVIPDDSVTEDEWYPSVEDRYGIAYGFNKLEWANKTAYLQLERVNNEHLKSEYSVKAFALEAQDFFNSTMKIDN